MTPPHQNAPHRNVPNRNVHSRNAPSRTEHGRKAHSGDAGNAALELVVLAPVLLAILGLLIAAGRTSIAQGAVDAAARDAARQASIALNPYAAQAAAQSSARAALRRDGLDCDPAVSVDTSGFGTSPGQPAAPVVATVTCAVPLANLYLPGLPGVITMTATFTSPLDLYRSRGIAFPDFRAVISLNPGRGTP